MASGQNPPRAPSTSSDTRSFMLRQQILETQRERCVCLLSRKPRASPRLAPRRPKSLFFSVLVWGAGMVHTWCRVELAASPADAVHPRLGLLEHASRVTVSKISEMQKESHVGSSPVRKGGGPADTTQVSEDAVMRHLAEIQLAKTQRYGHHAGMLAMPLPGAARGGGTVASYLVKYGNSGTSQLGYFTLDEASSSLRHRSNHLPLPTAGTASERSGAKDESSELEAFQLCKGCEVKVEVQGEGESRRNDVVRLVLSRHTDDHGCMFDRCTLGAHSNAVRRTGRTLFCKPNSFSLTQSGAPPVMFSAESGALRCVLTRSFAPTFTQSSCPHTES